MIPAVNKIFTPNIVDGRFIQENMLTPTRVIQSVDDPEVIA